MAEMKRGRPFKNSPTSKFVPGSDANPEEIFDFPYLSEDETIDYLDQHGRVMFIIRGLPGTGKSTLSSMITDRYSGAVVCSADNYFSQSFGPKLRNPDSLKRSHDFCARRVREESENGSHPIVVKNTHVRRWEAHAYLDIAAEYGYTVIMAITLRKFKVNAEILECSNKKGLNRNYLENRLRKWEEYLPEYLGWFLAPEDALFLCGEGKKALKLLLGDGAFCSSLDVFSQNEVWEHYKVESQLFCIATFCNSGRDKQMLEFYQSEEVLKAYGKHFKLTIPAVVVTKTCVLAIVSITQDMKSYMVNSRDSATWAGDIYELSRALSSGLVLQSSDSCDKSYSFRKDFPSDGKTVELKEWRDEDDDDDVVMNVNLVSVIVLAHVKELPKRLTNAVKFVEDVLSEIISPDGTVKNSELSELDDGTKFCRMLNDAWFVKLPEKIVVSSVLTGLYSK